MTAIALLGLAAIALLLLIEVIVLVHIIRRPIDTGMKIVWVILILCLPVIGLILYHLLGRRGTGLIP